MHSPMKNPLLRRFLWVNPTLQAAYQKSSCAAIGKATNPLGIPVVPLVN